ncbi:hypothetical protein LguiA_007974 [Lonicera macranthoides]
MQEHDIIEISCVIYAPNNGDTAFYHPIHTLLHHRLTQTDITNGVNHVGDLKKKNKKVSISSGMFRDAMFMKWTREDVLGVVTYHPISCVFAVSSLFFMGVEYTLYMIPPFSPPFNLGIVAIVSFQRLLASTPTLSALNFLLANPVKRHGVTQRIIKLETTIIKDNYLNGIYGYKIDPD